MSTKRCEDRDDARKSDFAACGGCVSQVVNEVMYLKANARYEAAEYDTPEHTEAEAARDALADHREDTTGDKEHHDLCVLTDENMDNRGIFIPITTDPEDMKRAALSIVSMCDEMARRLEVR